MLTIYVAYEALVIFLLPPSQTRLLLYLMCSLCYGHTEFSKLLPCL